MSANKLGKSAPRTMRGFTARRGLGKPIRQFDTSDLQQLDKAVVKAGAKPGPVRLEPEHQNLQPPAKPRTSNSKAVAVSPPSSLPPHLLMASLLEQLCHMYVTDRSLAQQLFKKLCKQLSKLNIIAPLSHLDEMSGLRFQHRSMLDKIMRTAIRSLNQPIRALTATENSFFMDRLSPPDDDIIGQQTSRYRNEFREMELLGKGGFGSVFKAQNYLDGREYAVKKIRFKQKHTDQLIKLLREVKALASLQHQNIVGYNAAWMEYDSPFASSNSSSSHQSPRSTDSSFKVSEKYFHEEKSMSIEFLEDTEGEKEAQGNKGKDGASQRVPLPGGGGMAMTARMLSSIQTEKFSSVEDRSEVMGADSGSISFSTTHDHTSRDFSLRQHLSKIEAVPESHFHQHSESSVSFVSSSISISDCVSNNHNNENIEVPCRSNIEAVTKGHQGLPFSNCGKSLRQPLHPQTQVEAASSCHTQSSRGDILDSTAPSSLDASGIVPAHPEKMDSGASDRHRSFGFRPGCNLYSRQHSLQEARPRVKIIPWEDSSSDSNNSKENHLSKKARRAPGSRRRRPSYHQRSISYDAASEVEEVMEARNHDYDFHNSITLYIQMELCGRTLQEWLVERNLEYVPKGYEPSLMSANNMRIFQQLLQGVQFIHSRGVIHRDLKPRNIFLSTKNLHVKIGDFGLAKVEVLSHELGGMSSPVVYDDGPFVTDNHTSGVGTSAYAAPEQLEGSLYDSKSDMFSLGVILFEIFNVFCTEMERVKTIESLRNKNKCSSEFLDEWPLQAGKVEVLTHPEPSRRPSAQDLLNSELFLSQEQKIKRLHEKVRQQESEIESLKRELFLKNRMIARLQTSFTEFSPQFSPFNRSYVEK